MRGVGGRPVWREQQYKGGLIFDGVGTSLTDDLKQRQQNLKETINK